MRKHVIVLLMLLGVALGACKGGGRDGDGNADNEASGEGETESIPVEVASIQRGDVYAAYSGTAAIEAFGEAVVVAKVGGEVREILVEEGDGVTANQILARLDGDRLRLELEQAKANLRKLERDYNRNVELHDKGLVSPGAFENLKYDLEALRAAYELARLELSYTEIRAPIDGVVSERLIKVGNTIAANDPTFRVTDLDPLIIYLYVPEREFRLIAAGQPATVHVDALGGRRFDGRVARVSPVVDPETGTFKVTVEVPADEGLLKPGMFGRISIVYDMRANVLQIPRRALVGEEGQPEVFIIEDGLAQRRDIRTGYSSGALVEVTEGLSGTEQVVVVGQTGLRDGTKVEVVPSGAEASGAVQASGL